jgi:ribulose-5-phosphate 4-epimerase/fuculose-1-phosphate aldolase
VGTFEAFDEAGKTLAERGLVRASEGNLSTFDGSRLTITRTGCRLGELTPADVLEVTLEAPPEASSSDLAIHQATYRERGAGAIAHAHPRGTVPEGWVEGEPHGDYVFAASLGAAVEELVRTHGGGA